MFDLKSVKKKIEDNFTCLYGYIKPKYEKIRERVYKIHHKIWHEFIFSNDIMSDLKKEVTFGLIVVFVFVFGFLFWAIFTNIDSAAIAQGKVVLKNSRKTIKHLEGGVVEKIYVRDGSLVKKGDPLIKLSDVHAEALYNSLHHQLLELYGTEARLIAERDNKDVITYPPVLDTRSDQDVVRNIMTAQNQLFQTDIKTYYGQLEILKQRVNQLQMQIDSISSQVESYQKQLSLIDKELSAVKKLDEEDLIEKPRLWALYREQARLVGYLGEANGKIAETQQKIGETQQQIMTFQDSTKKTILEKLDEVQTKLVDAFQRERSASDILNRTTITAPEDGTIINLEVHTEGSVVSPGVPLLDLVPDNDSLLIEAKINPNDIERVHVGLLSKVQLVSYKQRNTPTVNGHVVHVSADILYDEKEKLDYYLVKINVPASEIKQLKGVTLYLGMPVQVMIITDKRSPLDYFLTPFFDSYRRAFNEP